MVKNIDVLGHVEFKTDIYSGYHNLDIYLKKIYFKNNSDLLP